MKKAKEINKKKVFFLRYSLNEGDAADRIERAVSKALEKARTADIFTENCGARLVTCSEMGTLVTSLVE